MAGSERLSLSLGNRLALDLDDLDAKRVSPYHAQLINRIRYGSMLLSEQTLFVMETVPAGYIVYAANEAEKASQVTLLEVRAFGAFGRLYLGGEERDVMVASEAAVRAVESLTGREGAKSA